MYAPAVVGQWKTARISPGEALVTNTMYVCVCECSAAQSCLTPCEPRLLSPWDFSGKNTGVGCHFLLQGIFPTQGSNPCLLCSSHWQILYHCVAGKILPYTPKHEHKCTFFVCEADASEQCHLQAVNQEQSKTTGPDTWRDAWHFPRWQHFHKLSSTGKNAWPSDFNWWKEAVNPGSSVVCSEGSQESFPESS